MKIIEHFVQRNIAHNVSIVKGQPVMFNGSSKSILLCCVPKCVKSFSCFFSYKALCTAHSLVTEKLLLFYMKQFFTVPPLLIGRHLFRTFLKCLFLHFYTALHFPPILPFVLCSVTLQAISVLRLS